MADERSLDEQIEDARLLHQKLIADKNKGNTLYERIKVMTTDELHGLLLEKIVEHLGNTPTLEAIFQELKSRVAPPAWAAPEKEPPPPPPPT